MATLGRWLLTVFVLLASGFLGLDALFSDYAVHRGFAYVGAYVVIVHGTAGALLALLGRGRAWSIGSAWGAVLMALVYLVARADPRLWTLGLFAAPVAALVGHAAVAHVRRIRRPA